nr:transposase [Pedobacter cryoconitis]
MNKEAARAALNTFTAKWKSKYGYAILSWGKNWDELTSYFDFPLEIRKIIYTTNVIESLNSGIRKFTKSKSLFPDDQAALKAVYLSVMNIQKKWTMPVRDWGKIINQFSIIFENRCLL